MSKPLTGLFITGTDTNVGKTHIACQIARQLIAEGFTPIPRKPVESGCKQRGNELIPADALALQQACHSHESLQQICRFPLKAAISPAEAARLEHQHILLEDLHAACTNISEETLNNAEPLLLLEGAGGFYSPLCEDGLNADLAEKLALPVILVAEDRLGCINHILLSIQAIQSRNLVLLAVVLNQISATDTLMNNAHELGKLVSVPIIQSSDDLDDILNSELLNTLHTSIADTLISD